MAKLDPAIPLQPTVGILGREQEMMRLRARLRSGGDGAVTVLNGLPGVGKTTLATALAYDEALQMHFRHGVLWAGLGPEPNIPGLLSHWGAQLGISARQMAALRGDTTAWVKALRNAIGTRSMLLVIDDAWTLDEAQTFKVGGPNCAHLVTTRFPALAARIAPDASEDITTLRELGEQESMNLLSLLAPRVVAMEARKARDLVQAVGGLPLALTLMGNYLRKQSYTGQTRRIQAALKRLSAAEERLHISEPRTPAESHPSLPTETPLSLQSIIAVTDQFLNASARAALYALAVFPPKPNSFAEEAALAVAACDTATLDLLNDTGLLESSSSGRYTLHQTIADYARLRLDEASSRAAYERLITYATTYIETHKREYEDLDRASPTILAMLEAAQRLKCHTELVRAVIAFVPFLLLRGLYAQAEPQLQRALEAAQLINNHSGQASIYLYLADMAQKLGHLTQAESYLRQGLGISRQFQDLKRLCDLLAELGLILWKRGNFAEAEACGQEGLPLARQIGDDERICALLKMLSLVALGRGDYSQGESYLQESLSIARRLGDREQISVLLLNLGAGAVDQGHYARAESYLKEGLAVARQNGDRERSSALLVNLGEIAGATGNYAQAEAYYQEGLTLARQIEHQEWASILLANLGEVSIMQEQYEQAEAYLHESLVAARHLGRPLIIAHIFYHYGNLYLCQQRIEEAASSFEESLASLPAEDQSLRAQIQYGQARIAAALGNLTEARRLAEASATILASMRNHHAQKVREWLQDLTKEE